MTDHQLERALTTLLADGADRAPDGSRSLIAQRVARTRQRPTWLVRPYGGRVGPSRSLLPVVAVVALTLLALLAAVFVGGGGRVVSRPTLTFWDVGGSPEGIGVADGSVWVGDQTSPFVLRLDPSTGSVQAEVPTTGRSCGAIAEHDGEAWVPACIGQPFTRIATDTNDPREGLAAWGLQYAFHGDRAWVAGDVDLGELVSFDVATQGDIRSFPDVGGGGGGVDGPVIAGGSLWVSRSTPDRLLRLDPDSGALDATFDVPGAGSLLSAFDALWVTTPDGWLLKLDPVTAEELGRVEVAGTVPYPAAMAAGTDAVWVAAGTHVSLVDAATVSVRETLELPVPGNWVAADGDVAYVSLRDLGQVGRIEP